MWLFVIVFAKIRSLESFLVCISNFTAFLSQMFGELNESLPVLPIGVEIFWNGVSVTFHNIRIPWYMIGQHGIWKSVLNTPNPRSGRLDKNAPGRWLPTRRRNVRPHEIVWHSDACLRPANDLSFVRSTLEWWLANDSRQNISKHPVRDLSREFVDDPSLVRSSPCVYSDITDQRP